MTNTLNKDDDLLILSDGNSIDFWDSLTTETKVDDDFAFTIMEDESPVLEEVSSTKSELNDLLASTSNSTKNELSDLGNILGISPEKTETKEENNSLDFGGETIILDEKPVLEEPVKKVETETSNDLSGLLWEITAPKVEEKPLVEKAEEKISFLEEDKPETPVILEEPKKEEEKISFADVLTPEIQETKTETEVKNISNNVFTQVKDISGILASTIWQFVKRAEIVNSEISEKLSHIKILEAELATEKDLLADLENEKKAIEINQTAIEKMKNDYENPNSESSKTKKTSK